MWCKSAAECIANLKKLGVLPPERAEELERMLREKAKSK